MSLSPSPKATNQTKVLKDEQNCREMGLIEQVRQKSRVP